MWPWYATLAVVVVAVVVALKTKSAVRARAVRGQVAAYHPPSGTVLTGKRMLVLVNPVGGNRHAMRVCNDIVVPMLDRCGCASVTVTRTTHSSHAQDLGVEWATALLEGRALAHDAVLVLSGDGMFCECAGGFVGTVLNRLGDDADDAVKAEAQRLITGMAMAPIPCGSSNGLATSVMAPRPFAAMRRIIEAVSFGRPFDLTQIRFDGEPRRVVDSHFVNFGLVAEFDHACENELRRLGRDIKPLVAAAYVILRRKPRNGKVYFRPAEPQGAVGTRLPTGEPIPWTDLATDTDSKPVPDGVPGCPASEGWRVLTTEWIGVSICNTDWGADDTLYAPGIGNNCGTSGLVVTKKVGRVQLVKSFLGMETGQHLNTPANLFYRVDKWRVVPAAGVTHMDLSGRGVSVRPCSGETLRSAMTLLG